MAVLNKIENAVREVLTNELPAGMVYHSLLHTTETVAYAERIAKHSSLSEEEKEDLLLAAWLHDTGYVNTYEGHEEESVRRAAGLLGMYEHPDHRIDKVVSLIRSTNAGTEPGTESEKILFDADNINMGRKAFFKKSRLLRREWETVLGKKLPNPAWEQAQLAYLEGRQFQTAYARKKWGGQHQKNMEKQAGRVEKAREEEAKAKKPGRGIETMYRSVYRTHIDLSAIADSKANMMISINTIMVSIVVAAIGSGFTFTGRNFIEHVRFTIPMCVLVVGGLCSVIFAILSASPNVTSKQVTRRRLERRKASALFFGNFTTLERGEFVKSMGELRKSMEEIYDNMSVDIYDLGVVLRRKYRYLKVSYLSFMFSLILTVLTFLTLLMFSW